MKRSQRVGAICQILTESPGKIFSLSYFCEKFSAAKSSISEDISAAKEAVRVAGYGYIETIPGASGGVKYVTDISPEKAKEVQENSAPGCRKNAGLLGGDFLYTSDIFYNPDIVKNRRKSLHKNSETAGADYVATIETKGIPLAFMTLICSTFLSSLSEEKPRSQKAQPSVLTISPVRLNVCKKCPFPSVQ